MDAIVGVPTYNRPDAPGITSEQPSASSWSITPIVESDDVLAWLMLTPPHATLIVRTRNKEE